MRGFSGIGPVIATLCLSLSTCAAAHEIPNDVTVQAFLKPEPGRLRFLVRVPLQAMRDLDFPSTPQGYLDLTRMDNLLRDGAMLWISEAIDLYEGDTRLAKLQVVDTRISLPSDRSFSSYDEALAHVTGPRLPAGSAVFWNQVMMDVLFESPIHSDHSAFSIDPGGLARLGLRTITVLRYVLPDGTIRAFEYSGDPGLVRLDPRWHQAALRFVELGFGHILEGTDHLLFLFCLVIPFRKFRALVPVVTSFTIAHSITLIASAYNYAPDALWFPPLIETLIATSIVYMALENITGANVRRRWIITFGFGLVHGFGFSFALRQTLQFAGTHLLTSLLSFNLGVELGQLLVLVLLIPALELAFRFVVAERMGTIILSALVAHTGWHWMLERWEILRKFRIEWPAMNAALLAAVVGWLTVIVAAGAVLWLVFAVLLPRVERKAERVG
jgi:hypothetical protein